MNDVGTTLDECYKPYWIMLSSADVVLVGIITGSAVIIHKSANLVAIEKVVVSELLKRLWTFIVLIQISAVVTFGYDIAVRVLGGSELSCSGIFFHSQIVYSSILTVIMTAKFLFPLWGFLYAFDRKSFITVPHETKIFVVTQGDHSYRVLTTGRGCAYDDNASLLSCSAYEEPSTTQAIFGGAPGSTGLRSPPNQGALTPKEYWKTRTRHSRGSNLSMIKEDIVREVVVEVRTEAEVNQEPLY
ncbi:uncharacterized protein LOC136038546 isoform X2 [Artemia franciscana]|uniref:uncharacterized protein LOC136038546 isoform X2 n=1 Tax=Artemia franciscana TaxID=6661 RepID=UPI0032DBF273